MSYKLLHEPSRGIGGEESSRQAARRVSLPGGGRFSNITEDVRQYAAEPSGARPFLRRMTRRASRAASQQAIPEEEALQRGMAEPSAGRWTIGTIARQGAAQRSQKSKEFVKNGAEVFQPA